MSDFIWQAFLSERVRIESYALRRGRKSEKLFILKGLDTGELHPNALVSAVWEKIMTADMQGQVLWDPDEVSIFEFFRRCIHNHIRSFEKKVRDPHVAIVRNEVSSAGTCSEDELEDPDGLFRVANDLDEADLKRFIASEDAKLLPYAELLLGGCKKEEAAEILNISAATRHRMQTRLKGLVFRYCELASGFRPTFKKGSK